MSAVQFGPVEPMVFRPTVPPPETPWQEPFPPVVPDFDEPCPDCDGSGFLQTNTGNGIGVCSCDPAGVVQRVWRAERIDTDTLHHDTCLAVVSWYPVTELTYIGDDWSPERTARGDDRGLHPDDAKPRIATRFGDVLVFDGGPLGRKVTTEPWAADLEPGCVVVIPGDEVRLDEPITEMRTPFAAFHAPVIAPLALTDGLNDVDLGGQP